MKNILEIVEEKGPHTKPDKLGGGLRGIVTNAGTHSNQTGRSEVKTY